MNRTCCIGVAVLLSCGTSATTDPATGVESEAESALRACQTKKIAFSQATGCQNDGSVEFCVPLGFEKVVTTTVPQVRPTSGAGRAGCLQGRETLFFYPTRLDDAATCVPNTTAMTDAAWKDMCRLAGFRQIKKIVPTFFE
jgi:hypothetical protein